MKYLIVAATDLEIKPTLDYFQLEKIEKGIPLISNNIVFLITGAGIANTAHYCGKYLHSLNPELAINAGIAGAINKKIKMAQVVKINSDCFYELGAEDGDSFIRADALQIGADYFVNNNSTGATDFFRELPLASAITVNKVHGSYSSVAAIKVPADIESMEGAAFIQSCYFENVPCVQIRSVSNYVEQRDKSKWNIPEAIESLNQVLINFLKNEWR